LRRVVCLSFVVALIAPGLASAADTPPGRDTSRAGIEGTYRSMGTDVEIRIRHLSGDTYYLVASDGWEGIGMVDRGVYRGVFHYNAPRDSNLRGMTGVHTIDAALATELRVQASYTSDRSGEWTEVWKLTERSPPPQTPPSVDELAEAITRVAPEYPAAAREARVDGTVMLSANVREDGTVGDIKVVNSVPLLDAAAIAAVRQWRFKPASAKGIPVATWVAVPVKFSLH